MARKFEKVGLVGAFVGSLAMFGCGSMGMGKSVQTWTMNTAESIPAAEGKVKVASEKDGNTAVKVQVEHLAPASNLNEDASAYVVWIKADDGLPQNVGVLKVSDKRKGELQTKTPFKEFTVIVTAEQSAAVTIPAGQKVMDAKVTVPI